MAYNRLNTLLRWQKIIDIVNRYYEPGITTYAGVWRKYVMPVYPISYQQFIKIINIPNLSRQIEEERKKTSMQKSNNRQITLFDDEY